MADVGGSLAELFFIVISTSLGWGFVNKSLFLVFTGFLWSRLSLDGAMRFVDDHAPRSFLPRFTREGHDLYIRS
jgi:hypothetical protein